MNRIVLFDALKGVAMLSVVIWHLMNNLNDSENINSTFIYIFLDIVQLPLFMMISGYFCYRTKIECISIIKKRFCQLIFPIIFMGLLYILFISFKSVDFEFIELLKSYYTGANPYYFLICLFELHCIYLFTSFIKTVLSEKVLKSKDVKHTTSPVFIFTLGITNGILISEIL